MKLTQLIQNNTTGNRKSYLLNLVLENQARFEAAPASRAVRFHHAYDGGLVDHICEVAEWALALASSTATLLGTKGAPTAQEIVTVAILHDLNKLGDGDGKPHYIPNVSEKTGKRSVAEPYSKNKSAHKPMMAHSEADAIIRYAELSCGETSMVTIAAIAPEFLNEGAEGYLSQSEINAILFHDGGYGKAKYASGYQGKEDRLAILIHTADMLSSRKRNWEEPAGPPAE
jgi:hypothetical protein